MNTKASGTDTVCCDYDNTGWPRDFDIRIEVAEQQELLQESPIRQAPRNSNASATPALSATGLLTGAGNEG